jgi:hypothetical protein
VHCRKKGKCEWCSSWKNNLEKNVDFFILQISRRGIQNTWHIMEGNIQYNFPCYEDFHFKQLKITKQCIIKKICVFNFPIEFQWVMLVLINCIYSVKIHYETLQWLLEMNSLNSQTRITMMCCSCGFGAM